MMMATHVLLPHPPSRQTNAPPTQTTTPPTKRPQQRSVSLKKRVVDSPEVLSVIGSLPALGALLDCLHGCTYAAFFAAFDELASAVRRDLYLAPHWRHYMRELRLVAYTQLLESYKSVTLASMAAAFDVGAEFLDAELSGFIAAGRLRAKIDKVNGVVQMQRCVLCCVLCVVCAGLCVCVLCGLCVRACVRACVCFYCSLA